MRPCGRVIFTIAMARRILCNEFKPLLITSGIACFMATHLLTAASTRSIGQRIDPVTSMRNCVNSYPTSLSRPIP